MCPYNKSLIPVWTEKDWRPIKVFQHFQSIKESFQWSYNCFLSYLGWKSLFGAWWMWLAERAVCGGEAGGSWVETLQTSRQESTRSSCQSNKVLAAVHGSETNHYLFEWRIKGAGRGAETPDAAGLMARLTTQLSIRCTRVQGLLFIQICCFPVAEKTEADSVCVEYD